VLIKQVEDLDGLGLACYRIWMGAVLVSIAFVASGGRITRRLLRLSLLGGLTFGADIVLFFSAVRETSVANATVIGALQPILVLLVAARLFGETPRVVELVWGAVAIGGAALVVLGGDGGGANSLTGDLLAVGALVAWTGYFVFSKTARVALTAFEYLTGMAIVAAVAVVPIPLLFPGTLGTTDASGWLTIVYITVINGLLGHFLMSWAHGHVTLLTLSLLTLGIPVCSAAAAALWIDEPLTLLQIGGMIVVLAALGLVSASAARRSPEVVSADVDAIEAAPHP
jgi:drug/metabolite transporter (DMT)-like permease